MTHDELLALLNAKSDSDEVHALRAVVELHKPFISDGKATNICDAHEQCWGCGEWGSSKDCPCDKYPCTTIQAIEKELG